MRVLYISLIVLIIDQVSKLIVKGFSIPFLNINYDGMYHGQRIPVMGDFFRITFIENPGMAFGLDPGSDFKIWISLFSLVASFGLLIYLYIVRYQSLSLRVSLAFILGGALGNMIDRIFYGVFYGYAPLFYGRVVDFLDFDFFHFSLFGKNFDRWPIFNVADAAVTIGVLILIIFYKQHSSEGEETGSNNDNSNTENQDSESTPEISDKSDGEIASTDSNVKEEKPEDDKTDKGKEIPL